MNQVHALLRSAYAYSRNIFGKGIGIAVLDTGVWAGHPDLSANIAGFVDFVNQRKEPYDDHGHGTHVSGILAGSGQASGGMYMGIAPLSRLICLKVLDEQSGGKTETVVEACRWLLAHYEEYGIRIVNISVGAVARERRREDDLLVRAAEQLWDAGLVVVAAAGNNGPGEGSITVPGVSRKIITVGSLEQSPYGYSGRGPTEECIVKPEILAPGTNVVSCRNHKDGYMRRSGTSMAAPVVSGCIALLLEAFPDLNNRAVKMRLYERALPIPNDIRSRGSQRRTWGGIRVDRLLEDR